MIIHNIYLIDLGDVSEQDNYLGTHIWRSAYMLLKKKKYGFSDMITMSLKTSWFYSAIFIMKTIIDALLPTLSIFVTADFINTAIKVFNKETGISSVYISVALLGGIMIYNALIGALMSFVDCKRAIYFRQKLSPEMLAKRATLEYQYLENPETADMINRVCPNFDGNVWGMFRQFLKVVNLVIYIMGIIVTLFMQVWWIALLMLIASGPILYIATKAGQKSYDADREMSKIDRKVNYLSGIMMSREAVDERSIYGYTKSINTQYEEEYEFARKFRLKITRNNFIKFKMGGIVTTIYSVGAMLAMIQPTVSGDITIGMFIAIMGAVFGLSDRLSWGVNWLVQDIIRKREYLKELTDFMVLGDCEGATEPAKRDMKFNILEFKNVSFKYPGTNKLILDDLSFTIESGKHYSFVGVNGAGKTTITKLITGLYTNYEGEILLDGHSLRDLTQSEIKGLSSVVYQDFAKYYITLFDNLAVANFDNPNNREEAKKALALAGLSSSVTKLKDGLDTPLGKIMENGIDISGGEWQRVAMARSVMSRAPLKILDEPTAALDPLGESMVYKNFEQISKGMTTVFISHRLGATKLADVIYVLAGGKIIESGSHTKLMAEKGMYYEMFESQAQWYRSEEAEANV